MKKLTVQQLTNEFYVARRSWLQAIDNKQEHTVINAKWESFCAIARRLGRVPA